MERRMDGKINDGRTEGRTKGNEKEWVDLHAHHFLVIYQESAFFSAYNGRSSNR